MLEGFGILSKHARSEKNRRREAQTRYRYMFTAPYFSAVASTEARARLATLGSGTAASLVANHARLQQQQPHEQHAEQQHAEQAPPS